MGRRNIVTATAHRAARRGAGSGPKARDGTRAQLLEAAGQVFAEKGFDGATGKEICEKAGANAAAVVYHFGGMEELYAEVLREARNRLVSQEMLQTVVMGEQDPKVKLESFIRLLVGALAGPASRSWVPRVIGREMLAPSSVFDDVHDKETQSRAKILRSIVSELTGLPPEHSAVARATVSIMAPCGLLLIVSRKRLEHALPAFNIRPDSVDEITRHMTQFALAGLAAIARQAKK
jgi:AcrR family transcriptional regulator